MQMSQSNFELIVGKKKAAKLKALVKEALDKNQIVGEYLYECIYGSSSANEFTNEAVQLLSATASGLYLQEVLTEKFKLDEETREHLWHILNYLWCDEADHFESGPEKDHIFRRMERVARKLGFEDLLKGEPAVELLHATDAAVTEYTVAAITATDQVGQALAQNARQAYYQQRMNAGGAENADAPV